MKAIVDSELVNPGLLQIANMNYGQFQRWTEFVPLEYKIEVDLESFLNQIREYFANFREMEIEEDDTEGFPELERYKEVGWLELDELAKKYPEVLADVIKYEDYDILHHIVMRPVPVSDYYYSLNSVEKVQVRNDVISICGVCFKSDYIEHTFNYELPKKHALLKTND